MNQPQLPTQTILHNVEGPALISEIQSLRTTIESLSQKVAPPSEIELLNIAETARFLDVSKPTVHAWINKGLLKAYKIGNRTRLKKHEVEAALTEIHSKKGGRSS